MITNSIDSKSKLMEETVLTMNPPGPVQPNFYKDNHLTVNFEREVAYLDGAPLKLTYKAFCLLAFLVRHPGQLVSREHLLSLIWGYTPEIRTRTLDVHIRRLRKSLGHYGVSYIETIFGIGYRFQPWRETMKSDSMAPALTALDGAGSASPWKMAAGAAQ